MLLTSVLVLESLDELGTLQEKVLKGTSPGCASTIFIELNLVRENVKRAPNQLATPFPNLLMVSPALRACTRSSAIMLTSFMLAGLQETMVLLSLYSTMLWVGSTIGCAT